MEISRRSLSLGSAAAVLAAYCPAFAAQGGALVSAFADDRKSVKATRVLGGAGGKTQIEEITIEGEALGNSSLLQLLNRKATAVAVYGSPANHAVAKRTVHAAAPEMLFVIEGELTLTTEQGPLHRGVGSLSVFEDGATYSEKAGAGGYTAIKVRLAGA